VVAFDYAWSFTPKTSPMAYSRTEPRRPTQTSPRMGSYFRTLGETFFCPHVSGALVRRLTRRQQQSECRSVPPTRHVICIRVTATRKSCACNAMQLFCAVRHVTYNVSRLATCWDDRSV